MKSSSPISLFGEAMGSESLAVRSTNPSIAAKTNGAAAQDPGPQIAPPTSDELWESAVRVLPLPVGSEPNLLRLGPSQHYAAEQYRIIRTGVVRALKRPFLLAVSSPGVADGKTLTAVNVATAMALTGAGRTLLIDADLRGASVDKSLGIARGPGLAEVLTGATSLQSAIVTFDKLASLYVLPAGSACSNPTDLFDSPMWQGLAGVLKKRFTHVVVDCPPVSLFADYDLIAGVCEGVLAVVRTGRTDRELCAAALAKMHPKLTGVVMNEAEEWLFNRKATRRYYTHYGLAKPARDRQEPK